MKLIHSKIEPSRLLHIVNRLSEISDTRADLVPADQFLQMAFFGLHEGKTFKAHKHIPVDRRTTITQESWVVVKGSVKAILYDLDDTVLAEEILNVGDCSITLEGGHNYLGMEDGTIVYEAKLGPYHGQEQDKVFI